MSCVPVLRKSLRDQRLAAPAWGLMLGFLGAIVIASFANIDPAEREQVLQIFNLPAVRLFVADAPRLATVAGLLNIRLMTFLPFLIGVFAIVTATGTLAGERERGNLEVVMGYPIPRWRLALEKGCAVMLCTVAIALLMVPPLWLGAAATHTDLDVRRLALACLNAAPPAMVLGGLALVLSVLPLRRRSAAMIVAGVAIVSYLLNSLAALSPTLKPWRVLSIFYYHAQSQPLVGEMSWPHFWTLVAVAIVLVIVAPFAFERQDLAERTGAIVRWRLPWTKKQGAPRLLGSVFAKTLRDAAGSTIGWGLLMAFYVLFALAFYPTFTAGIDLESLMQQLGPVVHAFVGEVAGVGSMQGFLRLILFSLLPIFLAVFTIIEAMGAVAGEEDGRTLDMTMSNPVSRVRLVLEKFAALVVATIVIGLFVLSGFVLGAPLAKLSIPAIDVVLAVVNALLPALALGSLALALSCVLRDSRSAGTLTAFVAVFSFLVYNLAPLWATLRPLARLSVFYWYNNSQPLAGLMRWGDAGLLIVGTIALLATALWGFARRDIATG